VAALASGELLALTGYSLVNVFAGLALAIVTGIAVGLAVGVLLKPLAAYVLPFLRICEKLNPFALLPVFLLLLGIGREQKIAVVFWVAVWPLLFATIDGAKALDSEIIKATRSMGASSRELVLKAVAPMMVPSFFAGMKSSAQLSFFMIIASEMMGSSYGLGWYFLSISHAYRLGMMYGVILFITLLAIGVNVLFTMLERHFSRWRPELSLD
jgi:NitT/TauT family transport system permease protein